MGKLLYSLVPTNSDYLYLGYKGETNRIITAVYYIQNKPTLLLITVAMNQRVCDTMIQKSPRAAYVSHNTGVHQLVTIWEPQSH